MYSHKEATSGKTQYPILDKKMHEDLSSSDHSVSPWVKRETTCTITTGKGRGRGLLDRIGGQLLGSIGQCC